MSGEWQLTLTRPWHVLSGAGVVTGHEATTIDYSMDTISARAQLRFAGNPFGPSLFPACEVNQQVSIVGGYRDQHGALSTALLFSGFIEEDGASYSNSKLANVISVGDQMRLAQFTLGDPQWDTSPYDHLLGSGIVASYDGTYGALDPNTGQPNLALPSATNNGPGGSWNDIQIVQDLLTKAGVNNVSGISGSGVILGSSVPVILSNKMTPASLITQIDQVTGCKTFSTPTGPQRVVTTFTPNTGAAWTLKQGVDPAHSDPTVGQILEIENVRSLKKFYNRVIVKGLKLGGSQIQSIRWASSPNLPNVFGGGNSKLPFGRDGGQPISYVFTSDMIQSQSVADSLSASLLTIGNRLERRVRIKTAFNPDAIPGQTVAVYAPKAKISSTLNGYALGISHSLDSSGAFTTWTVAIYG